MTMAAEAQEELKGAADVLRKMRTLAPNLQRKGARRAARKAMAIVRDAAKANARAIDDPDSPQAIWKRIAIAESGRQSRREGGVVMRVGVRGGARSSKSKDPPWYWRLLELGTQHSRARPFMLPALANNQAAVTDKLVSELNKEIDQLTAGRTT